MIMSWFVINVFCFEWFSRHFFFQQSVGAVPLGVSVARKKEDEASVGSAPLARQQSNQASEYASSPVKTKTITGMITSWLKLTSSFFRLTQWIACTVWQYQLWEYCGTTLRFTEILSQKMATSLIKNHQTCGFKIHTQYISHFEFRYHTWGPDTNCYLLRQDKGCKLSVEESYMAL